MNLKIESRDADLKKRSLHPKQKEKLEDRVEPFSPRRRSRDELKDFHGSESAKEKKNTKLSSSGFGSLGLWAIGLLSVLFAYKRFTGDMELKETA